ALKMDRLVMQQNVEETRRLRQRLFDALRTRGLTVYPSVANFVLVRFPPGVDSKKVQQALAMQRIIVRDRSTLPLLDNCTRVTVGNAAETDLLLERLDRVLERIGT
ncbi:MAG TPA: aminotransferase class I/II-fold pyridoxal phosphate-dependent enzyme, partial [Candidatus Norongarragalinales archaeon]|nr:aminotransferase class I/II-fold pyridoxal phosphate-dependent enzyme [Candidatus Norongarragalinales archaeon]